VNPGYRVARNPSYEGIADDYRRTFRTLEALKPDVWLAPHNEFYGLDAKLARAAKDGVKAWIDPEGYRKWVAAQKKRFETGAENERAGPAGQPVPGTR
jgi:metallo-beta-lactamase class B